MAAKKSSWLDLFLCLFLMAIMVTPAALALWSSPYELPNEICEKNEKTGHKECTPHDPVLVAFWHVAKFFEDTESFFLVLLTLAIAGFTGTLWQSTRGLLMETKTLAKHAADQGDAFVQAERPHVFLKVVESGATKFLNGPKFMGSLFRYILVNGGRTPAFLTEIMEWFVVVEGRTNAPPPVDPMKRRGVLVPVGSILTVDEPYKRAINLLKFPNVEKIKESDAWMHRRLFFQGFVRYSDAFGKNYVSGFLCCYFYEGDTWALRGGEEHNYTREEKLKAIPEWTKEAAEDQYLIGGGAGLMAGHRETPNE